MNKNFTREDTIKKLETNVKSAVSCFALVGILGIVFIIRYFIKGDLDFYFSLSFTETMLWLKDDLIPGTIAYILLGVFLVLYIIFAALSAKKPQFLKGCLAVYLFDFLSLMVSMLVLQVRPIPSDTYIDVIIHGFALVFLIVGIISEKKLREMKAE